MQEVPTLPLRSGRRMPAIGLGTWELTDGTVESVRDALRLGYRMIDTSGDYGTQRDIGTALRADGTDRGSVFIVTKIEEDEDAYAAVRRNLAELGVDYADLVLIHRPPPRGVGMRLWQGLVRAANDGLCREIGVSNYDVGQIEELVEKTGVVPAVNQVEWTPFGHSKELLSFSRANRILLQAYSPLTRAERLDDERLGKIARRYRKSPAQILIRWNLELGTVPLPKAGRQDHRRENLDVFDFELDEPEIVELNELNDRWSALGEGLAYH
jgi:diketogulonate reductase-like aldo/keto reductase